MLPTNRAGVVSLDIPLRPHEVVEAWRPDSRRLLLPSGEPLPLQQRVAARISVIGLGVAATITGRVASASRHVDRYRIELVPDEFRLRALERLLEVARGEAVDYQPRAPRFLAAIPAVVSGPGGPTYMTTFSVSEKGCGLAWSGPAPAVGAPMEVRLGAGSRAPTFRSVVCWTVQSGRSVTVGVRFVAGPQSAWAMMLTDVSSSAPPA